MKKLFLTLFAASFLLPMYGMYTGEQLLTAAEQGNIKQVEDILKNAPQGTLDVNFKDPELGFTALHWAASNGQDKLTALLIRYGADINIQDTSKDTPLHYAAFQGSMPTVRLLLSKGANADLKNAAGESALDHARAQGHIEVAQLLENYMKAQTTPKLEVEDITPNL